MTPAAVAADADVVGVGLPTFQERASEPAICAAHTAAAAAATGKETVWTDFFVTAALKRKRGAVGMPFETGEGGREVGNNERAEQELKERRGFCRRMGNSPNGPLF